MTNQWGNPPSPGNNLTVHPDIDAIVAAAREAAVQAVLDDLPTLAEAWQAGEYAGRTHQMRLQEYASPTSISSGPPEPPVNPFRALIEREDRGRG